MTLEGPECRGCVLPSAVTTSGWALQDPVTVTFPADQWHLVLRELVYGVSTVEACRDDVVRTADPKQDAWTIAATERLLAAVEALDKVVELLHEGQARPVPTARPSQ